MEVFTAKDGHPERPKKKVAYSAVGSITRFSKIKKICFRDGLPLIQAKSLTKLLTHLLDAIKPFGSVTAKHALIFYGKILRNLLYYLAKAYFACHYVKGT